MQITLIRHLPTEWNKKTWLQGRKDIGLSVLTEKIITDIKQNQKVLNELAPFDLVLASTLKRTQQTANLYGFKPKSDQLLNELDFGPFEGMPKKMLLELHGDIWVKNPSALVLGERVAELGIRVVTFSINIVIREIF